MDVFRNLMIEAKPVAFQKRYLKVDKDEFRDIELQASSATIYKNKYSLEKRDREKLQRENWDLKSKVKKLTEKLDKHLKAEIPHIYERGIVNGQTVGVESVKELKQLRTQEKALNMEIEKLTQQRDDVTSQIQAKTNKKDELYTQLKDIENELRHYKEHFKGKTVY